MKITDRKSYYYGWYEIIVPAEPPVVRHGFVEKPDMREEMREWLLQNVGPVGRSTWINGSVDRDGRHVIFRNKDKAMLFKLTWA